MSARICKINEVYAKLDCSAELFGAIYDELTFEVPGAKWSPRVREGLWDGKIRMLNNANGKFYMGLVNHVRNILINLGEEVHVEDGIFPSVEYTTKQALAFVETLNLPFEPHDYQVAGLVETMNKNRVLFESPTNSGKSLLYYLIARQIAAKSLIIVPTKTLVKQMAKDFKGYGYQPEIHMVTAGVTKDTDQDITISTWQSVWEQPAKFFHQFDLIIGDEAHGWKAASLKSLMEKTTTVKYKVAGTGSLDGMLTNQLTITGLFGDVYVTATNKELIERGISSAVEINVIILKHRKEDMTNLPKKHSYQQAVNYIISNPRRNKFIARLAGSLKGNTLLLFRRIEDHGDLLIEQLERLGTNKTIHYIHGKAEPDPNFKLTIETTDNNIAVASDGTTATGISINNFQNLIKGQPLKSIINVKQSIGRLMRLDGKTNAVVQYDITDDLSDNGGEKGVLYSHLIQRLKIYVKEGFKFKIYEVDL